MDLITYCKRMLISSVAIAGFSLFATVTFAAGGHYQTDLDSVYNGQLRLRGHVSVGISPHQREVVAGDTVYYTLSVTNHSTRTQHDLDLSFQFADDSLQIRELLPADGIVAGDMAVWHIPYVFAGQTWKATFPVHVKESTPEGVRIPASVRVSGPEVNPAVSPKLSDGVLIGTPVIPPTGSAVDLLLILSSCGGAVVLTSKVSHRRKQVHTAS